MSDALKKAAKKIKEEQAQGLRFAGRSSIESLDLVDFQKKEYCAKIIANFKEKGLPDVEFGTSIGTLSIVEFRAVLSYRSDRLTLERLVELYSASIGDRELITKYKTSVLAVINQHKAISKVPLNDGIRLLVQAGNTHVLHLDFLISLVEKLEIIAPSGLAIGGLLATA